MKANRRSPIRAFRLLMLPRDERAAAKSERRAEERTRRERDNEHSAERRAASVEAQSWRDRNSYHGGA